jgi:secreted trypsin-like serine protease
LSRIVAGEYKHHSQGEKEKTIMRHATKQLAIALAFAASALPGCALESENIDLSAGTGQRAGEIVGGQNAIPGQQNWQISLQARFGQNFSHICGGSILAARWVVTAAHCVDGSSPGSLRVVAGEHRLNRLENIEQFMSLSRIIVHPDYNPSTSENDIALLELSTPLILSSARRAATIAPFTPADSAAGLDAPGTMAKVTGWGTTSEGGFISNVLKVASVPVISDEEARAAYGDADVADSMIGAGFPEGGVDTCQGDSGGPLVLQTPDGPKLAGLTSWGIGCARPGLPGIYTEVSHFNDFIAANVVP